MSTTIQAIRGMNDILPQEAGYWALLENRFATLMHGYGYEQIRLPILEKTVLFKRSIGEVTDIVEKEMYTFDDRNGESLTLRPEGTAGCVRACIENALLYNQTQKLWYQGPMFRYERPQRGRYRQFHQFGVEAFGLAGPDIDAELILLTARLWQDLGIADKVTLELNSLGSLEARAKYKDILVDYLTLNQALLDEDSQKRLASNPLRILDSKNPAMADILSKAPALLDHLDEESAVHFKQLRLILDKAKINYKINTRLVRGLDYYSRTVFEWVTPELGAQATVCAGGRYDGLVTWLGGQTTPAVGFAMGIERLVELLKLVHTPEQVAYKPDAYLVLLGELAEAEGLALAETLRTQVPGLQLVTHCGGGSFKSQFKRADKSGAALALILGENEVQSGVIGVKYLRIEQPQVTVALNQLPQFLQEFI